MVRLAIHVPWGGQQQRGAWGRCEGKPHDATRPDINRSARQLFLLTNFLGACPCAAAAARRFRGRQGGGWGSD